MKKNDIITLKIDSISNLGFGIGRIDGLVVFVAGLVPEDVADVKIIKLTSSYAVGRVEKIIEKSTLRCDTRCGNAQCFGCAYKNITYGHETKIKREDVRLAFVKEGLSNVIVEELVKSPKLTQYRNKAQYRISINQNGEYIVGFYAPKSHNVREARSCPLAPKIFIEIIDELTAFFKKHNISVYDEKSGVGLLRHIYLRRGEVSKETLLTIVINGETIPHSDELVDRITKQFPSVVGILLNINCRDTNVVLGEKFITLYGRSYIYDTLAGVRLKISAESFYQVNHGAAELLYNKAKSLAEPTKDDTLLDLFCGAGSIGLSMADEVGELIGIEIVDSAVLCARENAISADILNASFFAGDATNTEKLLDNAERELSKKILPTIVVLDPPRKGCDEALIKYVVSLEPKKIVYISCNPTTLARDVRLFSSLGYDYGSVTPFDMFPMSGHVESVVCLTRTFDN